MNVMIQRDQFKDRFPEVLKAIAKNHYVDDYFDSCYTVHEAIKLFGEVFHG